MREQMFKLGETNVTPGAKETFTMDELFTALCRHLLGDWGDLTEEDRSENEFSLNKELRLLSAYNIRDARLWILTEADRSMTTLLLPEEY